MDDASLNYIPFGAQQRIFSSGGLLGAAKGGLSRLASSLAGAGNTYQQGYDQQMSLESKLAQALAAARASDAQAQLHGVQAAEGQRKLDLGSPQGLREAALLGGGIPLDQADAFDQFTRTGTAPPGANWSPVAQRLAASQLVLGGGAKSQEDYFKGQGDQQQNAITGALVNGGLQGPQRDVALALMKAAPMFHAGPDGMVMSQYSGTVDTSNPLAQSNIGLKGAEAGKNRAQAAQANAAAGEHTAGAALKRAETTQYTGGDIDTTAAAIANGQIPPPSGAALINPKNQRLLARVMEINPDYDYTTVTAKKAAATGFTTGQQGNSLRSVATANAHLDQLGELADAMDNGKSPIVNRIVNWYQRNTGDPAVTSFDAVKNVVGQEVVKAIVANGGSEGERSEAAAAFNNANSPAQLKGVIGHYRAVMQAQQDNLMEQRRAAGLPDSTLPKYDTKLQVPSAPAPSPAAAVPAGAAGAASAAGAGRTVVRTGTLNGRKVIQYSDGSTQYAN